MNSASAELCVISASMELCALCGFRKRGSVCALYCATDFMYATVNFVILYIL